MNDWPCVLDFDYSFARQSIRRELPGTVFAAIVVCQGACNAVCPTLSIATQIQSSSKQSAQKS
jgi:hypothetical protein